jgi:hypothetical protein
LNYVSNIRLGRPALRCGAALHDFGEQSRKGLQRAFFSSHIGANSSLTSGSRLTGREGIGLEAQREAVMNYLNGGTFISCSSAPLSWAPVLIVTFMAASCGELSTPGAGDRRIGLSELLQQMVSS